MTKNYKIVLLPGDGIGPEVLDSARQVMKIAGMIFDTSFDFVTHAIGGASIEQFGVPVTEETLSDCCSADGVLFGAVGDPRYDDPGRNVRPEQGLLALRKRMGVYANLRPIQVTPALMDASPLREERIRAVDLLVVRELTGGLYFGPRGTQTDDAGRSNAFDTLVYGEDEIERVLRKGFEFARSRKNKLSVVDKANVLDTSRLWRKIAKRIHVEEFPQVELEFVLVDTAAMRLITHPGGFDVIVTENMFGDILTDEASVIAGSMGLLPSASLGDTANGLYEPIHGSAPDIAGKGIANPCGAILSAALLFRYSLNNDNAARRIETAVKSAYDEGWRTPDLNGRHTTKEFTSAVIAKLSNTAE